MAQPAAYHRVADDDDDAAVDNSVVELDDIVRDESDDDAVLPIASAAASAPSSSSSSSSSLSSLRGRRKPAVLWLIVFFLINSLAFGIAVVPRMNLIVSLICRHTLSSLSSTSSSSQPPAHDPVIIGGYNPQCAVDAVSAQTALVASFGNVVSGVLSIFMSTFLSLLSDRVGRVKVVAFAATGLMAAEGVLVALANAPGEVSYRWLYAAYMLDGLSGSFAVIMAMASAYISDCTVEEKRNVEVGRIHGSMFIGIAIGPAISSAIIAGSGQKTPLLVFYVCIAMRLISLAYLLAFVPESLPRLRGVIDTRNNTTTPLFSWQQMQPTKGFNLWAQANRLNPRKWLDRLVPPGVLGNIGVLRRNVVLLLAVNVICYTGAMATADVLILYPQRVFKWGNVENNTFMSVVNAFRAAVSYLGIPLLIKLFRKPTHDRDRDHHHHASPPPTHPHPSPLSPPQQPAATADALDRHLILTALAFDLLGYIGYALAPSGALFTLCGAAAAFGAIGLSTTEAALTKHVAPARVGELMGGLGLLQAVVRIVAPATVNLVYGWSVGAAPGLAFAGVAALLGVGLGLGGWVRVG